MLSGQTELPYEVLCQRRSYEYREHPLSIEFDLAPSVVGSMIGRVGGVVMFRSFRVDDSSTTQTLISVT